MDHGKSTSKKTFSRLFKLHKVMRIYCPYIAFVCPYKKESIVNTMIFGTGNKRLKYNDIYSITYFADVNREVGFFTRTLVINFFF